MKFGKYDVLGRIGRGGMADVLLAEAHGASGFTKKVVLKLLLPHLALEQDFRTMFIDEARLVAGLTHPSIVQTHDLGEFGGRHYIEMEYVPGSTLGALAKEPLPLGAVIGVLYPVLMALGYAHARGIVHRDVSPLNVLVSRDGLVKVSDFGIAKGAMSQARTRTGVIKGKFSYMSPEQAGGKPATRQSDIYSAGIVAYELLTGTRLFDAPQELDILRMVRSPKVTAHPAVPASVMRALSPDPTDRFADAESFARALLADGTPWTETDLRDWVAREHPEDSLEPVEADEIILDDVTAPPPVSAASKEITQNNPVRARLPLWPIGAALVLAAGYVLWPKTPPPAPAIEPLAVAALPDPKQPASAPQPLMGYITVNARPWAAVSIDGHLVAKETPLIHHKVEPGKHRVELTRKDGLKSAFDVDVQAGETVSKFEDWTKAHPRR